MRPLKEEVKSCLDTLQKEFSFWIAVVNCVTCFDMKMLGCVSLLLSELATVKSAFSSDSLDICIWK